MVGFVRNLSRALRSRKPLRGNLRKPAVYSLFCWGSRGLAINSALFDDFFPFLCTLNLTDTIKCKCLFSSVVAFNFAVLLFGKCFVSYLFLKRSSILIDPRVTQQQTS